MTHSELEDLIRLITTEVLKAVSPDSQTKSTSPLSEPGESCQCSSDSQSTSDRCCHQKDDDSRFERSALCASDLLLLEEDGKKRILLSPGTIVTPLAAELARDKQIALVRSEREEGKKQAASTARSVIVLSQNCSQSQRQAVINAAATNGYSAQSETALGNTAGMILKSAVCSAERVTRGENDRLIVLDENVYSLSVQLKRLAGVNPKICWDPEAAAENRSCNVLLLNSRSLGIQMIRKITNVWLQV